MKANGGHIVPRLQEPSNEKIGTAGLVKKLVNDVKATGNHIVPRLQEFNSEKLSTTGIALKVTFGTTKKKMPTIEECTDIKTRPSKQLNDVRPSINQTKIQARVNVCAETRDNIRVYVRDDERAETRDNKRVYTRVDKQAETRVDKHAKTKDNKRAHSDPSGWDPGGGPVKPQDYCLEAWWG